MFQHLLTPYTINNTIIPNRFVLTSMGGIQPCDENGILREEFLAYFEERAKGNWGLIVSEAMAVMPDSIAGMNGYLNLYSNKQLSEHKKLTECIHKYDSKIIAQLCWTSMMDKTPKAPSPFKDNVMQQTASEYTVEEIRAIVEAHGDAALRAKEAGYDGIELHGGNRYTLLAFASPLINKRTDEYGGNFLRRAKVAIDIVKNIRKKTGNDFLIIYKMSVIEFAEGGQALTESQLFAKMLEEAGVDIICCAQGGKKDRHLYIAPYFIPKGMFIDNTAAIREAVSIPVIANGRIVDPEMGEFFIANGKADFIGMGRESIADPYLPKKILEGNIDEIIRCIGCEQGCIGEIDHMRSLKCLINPRSGDENTPIKPVFIPKDIIIVGGGIAGCEAAIWAAKRGHRVSLYEKDNCLGGQWRAACVPLCKADFGELIHRQKFYLNKYGVNVKLNHEITSNEIRSLHPDSVIIATGSTPKLPPIQDLNKIPYAFAKDILLGKEELINCIQNNENKVLHAATAKRAASIAIIGGGSVGIETAGVLATNGYNVTVLEQAEDFAIDAESSPRKMLLEQTELLKIELISEAVVIKVDEKSVIYSKKGTEHKLYPVDMVIIAVGSNPNSVLAGELDNYQGEMIVIGDANQVGNGFKAVREGYQIGMNI